MGVVNTTYTFTATDTITSDKMNNIIDETTFTSDAVVNGGSGPLVVSGGKLSIKGSGITSNEMASNSVTTTTIANGSVTPAKLSAGAPVWSSGTTTIQPALELGGGITSSQNSYVDFHSVSPVTDYEARVIRASGANGDFAIRNSGTGLLAIIQEDSSSTVFQTNSAERMRITASGNIGIGNINPPDKLTVSGNVRGNIVYGNRSSLDPAISGGLGISIDGTLQSSIISPSSSSMAILTGGSEHIRITSTGAVGIGTTTPSSKLQVNGTVTATSFSGPLTGNVTGSASTVNDGAITATKLSGAQGGSAPIYGTRAWSKFATSGGAISSQTGGNLTITRRNTGRYTATFGVSTPLLDANYCVIGAGNSNSTDDASSGLVIYCHSKTTTGFEINVSDASSGTFADPIDANIMVIR